MSFSPYFGLLGQRSDTEALLFVEVETLTWWETLHSMVSWERLTGWGAAQPSFSLDLSQTLCDCHLVYLLAHFSFFSGYF